MLIVIEYELDVHLIWRTLVQFLCIWWGILDQTEGSFPHKIWFLMILLILFSVVLEVIKMQSVQNLLEPILEPFIRRVVSLLSQIILFLW